MTRTEALRKVYKKVTNEEAPVTANTITEVLVALADKYSGDEPVTANTITDALVALADNYSGGGGGGSSDFSTATVTVINSSRALGTIGVISPFDEADTHVLSADVDIIQGTNEFQCVLYKGFGWIDVTEFTRQEVTVTVSGNATYLGDGDIDVTGDCTITMS